MARTAQLEARLMPAGTAPLYALLTAPPQRQAAPDPPPAQSQKHLPLVTLSGEGGQEQETKRVHVYGKDWALQPCGLRQRLPALPAQPRGASSPWVTDALRSSPCRRLRGCDLQVAPDDNAARSLAALAGRQVGGSPLAMYH